MLKRYFVFGLLFISMAQSSFALQIKSVVDNETAIAKISSIDVTRIFVQGDRIASVKGIKGAYTRENDAKNGEIYIQPTAYYQTKSFTILIETESGRHFTLLLNPTYSPSETLMLVPKGIGVKSAKHFEQEQPYEVVLNHLIRAMRFGSLPDGYISHLIDNKVVYRLNNKMLVTLKAIYTGYNLQSEMFEISNLLDQSIQLDERQFYKKGVRAISLDRLALAPRKKAYLYRVISHD